MLVASTSPADPRNQRAARELINIALRGAIQIQTMIIADAGVRFIEGVDSESWEVGMEFLGWVYSGCFQSTGLQSWTR